MHNVCASYGGAAFIRFCVYVIVINKYCFNVSYVLSYVSCYTMIQLKLRQHYVIHTYYMLHHCTTLHII